MPAEAAQERVAGPPHASESLFERHPANPILVAADWPYPVHSVFNAGAAKLANGTTVLLCRVEDYRGHSHLTAAYSANGVDGWRIEPQPTLAPQPLVYREDFGGYEDPRITWVPELQKFAVAYTIVTSGGPAIALTLTADFRQFERLRVVLPPPDKDAALFPRRIGEHWAMIHRPESPFGEHMWVSYSPDLRHWGSHKIMLVARSSTWWDSRKVGLAGPPIETAAGWLVMYHGVRQTAAGAIYRLGLALFDIRTPEHCLLRGGDWVFGPAAAYEWMGDVPGVVFPCGHTLAPDGDTLYVYYGAADTVIALATTRVSRLLEWLQAHGQPTPDMPY